MKVINQVCTINNPKGMHSRVAKQVAGIVRNYHVEATVVFNGEQANAESILELLSLAITHGADFSVSLEGPLAKAALGELTRLFNRSEDP